MFLCQTVHYPVVPKFSPVALLSQIAGIFFSLLMLTEFELAPRGNVVPNFVTIAVKLITLTDFICHLIIIVIQSLHILTVSNHSEGKTKEEGELHVVFGFLVGATKTE